MKEYDFEIKETSTLRYTVEAKNVKNAMKCVQAKLQNGDIMMDEGRYEWEIALVPDKGAYSESR